MCLKLLFAKFNSRKRGCLLSMVCLWRWGTGRCGERGLIFVITELTLLRG
jgi:hypothetical protein